METTFSGHYKFPWYITMAYLISGVERGFTTTTSSVRMVRGVKKDLGMVFGSITGVTMVVREIPLDVKSIM